MPFKKKKLYIYSAIYCTGCCNGPGMTLPPTHTTHPYPPHPPTPPMPSHASLDISPNVCHVTSHYPSHTTYHPTSPTHPTLPYPCIPTHSYTYPPRFVMLLHTPTPPHPSPHTPPHTSNPCLPMHPYPTLHLNIFKV